MREELDQTKEEIRVDIKKSNYRDKFILIGLIIIACESLYWYSLNQYVLASENYDIYTSAKPLSNILAVGISAAPVLIAIGIRNKRWRMIGVVVASICALIRLYWLYKSLENSTNDFVFFEF